MRNVGRADKADSADGGVVQNGVDHFLVAMHDLANAFGQASFDKQFRQAHRNAWVALAWLDDEGIARRNRGATHPQGDHAGEVERGDACTNADWLTHRIYVNAGASALAIFAFHNMRDAAAKFDDFQPALNVALAVRNDLAMFGRQHVREIVHVGFNQAFKFKHHACTALRVGRRPRRLRSQCCLHRAFQHSGIAQCNAGLNAAIVWIHYVAKTRCAGARATANEMIDLTHSSSPNSVRRQCPCQTINATSVYCGSKISDGAYMGFRTP